nr:hypothetical protein [Saccharothrix deserti]
MTGSEALETTSRADTSWPWSRRTLTTRSCSVRIASTAVLKRTWPPAATKESSSALDMACEPPLMCQGLNSM